MKLFPNRRRTFASVAFAFFLIHGGVFGIPQNFSQGNPFLVRAGKPAEEFFRDPATWTPGAQIPGEIADKKSERPSIIETPGDVFGVSARHIKLLRDPAKELQQVIVRYDAGAAHLSARNLHTRLKTNIAAFLETKPADGPGKLRFAGRELIVTLPRDAAPELEVCITRAESSSSHTSATSRR